MNKTQAEILAEQVVEAVFAQLDRDCEWRIGKEHTLRIVKMLLQQPKRQLKRPAKPQVR